MSDLSKEHLVKPENDFWKEYLNMVIQE